MNRTIKFCGKSEFRDEWYEGDFITDTQEFNRTCDNAYILPHWSTLNGPIPVIKESVGQHTGVNNIYEGDIVLYIPLRQRTNDPSNHVIGVVQYVNHQFCIVNEKRKYKNIPLSTKTATIEVIGKFYDNPQLLDV